MSPHDGQSTTSVRQSIDVTSLAKWMTTNEDLKRFFQFHPVLSSYLSSGEDPEFTLSRNGNPSIWFWTE